MRVKIDENLSAEIAAALRGLGHDAHTVAEEGLAGYSDDALWKRLVRESRLLITQDVKFADARRAMGVESPGIMLVRMDEAEMDEIRDRVIEVFSKENTAAWQGKSISVTPARVRVYPDESTPRRRRR